RGRACSRRSHAPRELARHPRALHRHRRRNRSCVRPLPLLGFRFAPRIRDLADRRLYIVGARTAYKALDPLIGGTIDSRIIAEIWDELLRLAVSIKAGTVAPSAI